MADLAEESCVALPWRPPSGATEQPVLCSQAWRGSVGLKGSQAGGQGADAIEGSGPLQRADRTGDAIMQSEYSGAGPRPSLAPWPKRKGRMYMEPPEPYGGTKSMLSAISRSRPSSNISGLTSGMARRWQPEASERATCAGHRHRVNAHRIADRNVINLDHPPSFYVTHPSCSQPTNVLKSSSQ